MSCRHALTLGVVTAAFAMSSVGCGIKGPPQPPLPKTPDPVSGLSVRQSGARIEIRWARPARRSDGAPLDGPLSYEILARAVDRAAAQTFAAGRSAEEGFLKGASVIGKVLEDPSGQGSRRKRSAQVPIVENHAATSAAPAGSEPLNNQQTAGAPVAPVVPVAPAAPVTAAKPVTESKPREFEVWIGPEHFPGTRFTSVRLAFAVIAVDAHGRRSRAGHIVELDPIEPLPSLEGFSAEGTPEGVRLSWTLPPRPTAGVGVNIYRRESDAAGRPVMPADRQAHTATAPIPGSPFQGTSAVDTGARIGGSYDYEARLTATTPGKGLREGPTAHAHIDHLDRFPPGPPALVTAAVVSHGAAAPTPGTPPAPGTAPPPGTSPTPGAPPTPATTPAVHLQWSAPIDADVGGYRIYRAVADGAPVRMAEVPSDQTSWEDTGAQPGTNYRYTITAIDRASPPNEGPPSEPVEVEVPPSAPPPAGASPDPPGKQAA